MLSWLDMEFIDGYRDGRTRDCMEPSGNRSPAYHHSFEIGRAEINGTPIPAYISRQRVAEIERNHSIFGGSHEQARPGD